jgi:hypothetical protein
MDCTKTLFLCCSAIIAYRWLDIFHCYKYSHWHELCRKHYSSVVAYGLPPSNRSTCHIAPSFRLFVSSIPTFLLVQGLCILCLFFRFEGGRLLHDAQSLTFHNLREILTARLATSSPRVCLMVLLNALSLPRRS